MSAISESSAETCLKIKAANPRRAFAISVLLLTGCDTYLAPWAAAPGEGLKAERGYDSAQPVITALADYHAEYRNYPESLARLIPDFASDISKAEQSRHLRYVPLGQTYELSFSYEGPGMNTCVYRPGGNWRCGGFF